MSPDLETALQAALGSSVSNSAALGGGDINDAHRVVLADGRVVFVKSNPRLSSEAFRAEARGLDWLREAGALRLPQVLAIADESDPIAFLVLEMLEPGRPGVRFDEVLGQGLAQMHRLAPKTFGLDHDNLIGSLPQLNTPSSDWVAFFRERRLLPQFERAARAGQLDGGLQRSFERLSSRLDDLVGPREAPARLHGDLWGGNLHVGPAGEPCLIDPACYGGHREVDLAMMRLFGGFSQRVFDAYAEVFPLANGHEARVPLYQLYPILVHVNLFGGGYVGSLARALRSLV
jgi:fructosamine-3-kinase